MCCCFVRICLFRIVVQSPPFGIAVAQKPQTQPTRGRRRKQTDRTRMHRNTAIEHVRHLCSSSLFSYPLLLFVWLLYFFCGVRSPQLVTVLTDQRRPTRIHSQRTTQYTNHESHTTNKQQHSSTPSLIHSDTTIHVPLVDSVTSLHFTTLLSSLSSFDVEPV